MLVDYFSPYSPIICAKITLRGDNSVTFALHILDRCLGGQSIISQRGITIGLPEGGRADKKAQISRQKKCRTFVTT